jgi:hypothetical protein
VDNPWTRLVTQVEDYVPSHEICEDVIRDNIRLQEEIADLYEDIWKDLRAKSMDQMRKTIKSKLELKVGDLVYVWVPPTSKISPKWTGPHKVEEVRSSVQYVVNGRLEHVFNLKRAVLSQGRDKVSRKRSSEEERKSKGHFGWQIQHLAEYSSRLGKGTAIFKHHLQSIQ